MEKFEETLQVVSEHDPYYFIKEILGYKQATQLHKEMLDFVTANDGKKLLLEPRFHFKSSIITIGFSIWSILKNPDIRILITSKTLAQSRQLLSEIKGHFEHNKVFKALFGDWKGEIWREDRLIVSRRKRIVKEPTIAIGAVGHELTSGHYDLIINDDLVGLTDMVSEVFREATLRFYKLTQYLTDKGTHEINIGTRYHVMDVYSHILKHIDKKNVLIRKAILEDGTVLFKERFTLDDLMKLKNEDPILFEAQMQNNPTAIGDQLYPLEKLHFFDRKSFQGTYNIAYVDPAFGKYETKQPCFFSFIIGSIVNDDIYITEWITNRAKPKENEILMLEKIREHSIRELGIETNAQQSEFARNVQKEIDKWNASHEWQKDKIYSNIQYIVHNTNKDRRIQGMHGTVTKNVYFRKDWQECYDTSMTQLILYPYAKFKDAPDALEGLIGMTKYMGGMDEGMTFEHESKKIF